jgi:hypothetical protein
MSAQLKGPDRDCRCAGKASAQGLDLRRSCRASRECLPDGCIRRETARALFSSTRCEPRHAARPVHQQAPPRVADPVNARSRRSRPAGARISDVLVCISQCRCAGSTDKSGRLRRDAISHALAGSRLRLILEPDQSSHSLLDHRVQRRPREAGSAVQTRSATRPASPVQEARPRR